MISRLMFLIHWVVWSWTFLFTILLLFFAFQEPAGPPAYFLKVVEPGAYVLWGGPILIFLIMDYIIIGELTALPWEREK